MASTDTEEETPSEPASIYLVTQGDTVTVVDEAAMLNGCVDVDVTVDIDGAHIVVKELEILTEQDICRCVYPRELSAKISHPPEGDYTVEVPKVSTDGIEMSMKTLSFKCLHSPDDWQYNGIVCVN